MESKVLTDETNRRIAEIDLQIFQIESEIDELMAAIPAVGTV